MIHSINKDITILKRKSSPANRQNQVTVQDLTETLEANREICAGMAANMIGINKRIIAIQMGPFSVPMINPIITKKEDMYQTQEGCLSLTGQRSTQRFKKISITYLDSQWQQHSQEFTDWTAQVIQHEIDHCNGILI
ncbi:peptide deformylase [Pediococcus claussenii]|uniref:Polypeptide deformylase family protein n=1 Tax=Pediococcus claussenii (strain ATCC BAA-344 / DSM 14800 / JCM 18046 / KCTC 3811 / LMG 21948 / P06) TaxID=701521 RepID=G8PAH7_PEDCP|nr:peptide deformylase [Pediococcus claussenii]AEV95766.1 polypeptide deformylase family protein [Pediococcus claussenii ATCC BAA-344]ANZ69274.1 peptide deformylase [Pediococcus claussenii]ANZ71093.1 peptide deformylase [Pediococcus claussenii]KRN20377.1 hypothetical protein IV79_GL000430 [Pediococcus claussenii]